MYMPYILKLEGKSDVKLPYILKLEGKSDVKSIAQESSDILKIFWSNLVEMLSVIMAAGLIETKYFGRKNSMILFYFLTGFICFIVFFCKSNHFVVFVTVARFFLCITTIFCFQFSSEIYSTKIRTTGLGMANGIGRVVGNTDAVDLHWNGANRLVWTIFRILCDIAWTSSIISYMLPFDTTGKELDM